MMEKEMKKPNKYKNFAIAEMIFIVFLLGCLFYSAYKDSKEFHKTPEELCSEIKAVPSWVKDGIIVNSGYKGVQEGIVDVLIKEEIYFLYNSQCGYCKKQIEAFGDDWNKYVESGLTFDCSK